MTLATTRNRSWRPWQMRLRTLMVLMVIAAIAAIAAAICGWRQRRSEYLIQLVETFNAALDEQRYKDAERIACEAIKEFPANNTAVNMREKSRLVLAIINGTEPEGYVCGTGSWTGSGRNDDVSKTSADELEGGIQCP